MLVSNVNGFENKNYNIFMDCMFEQVDSGEPDSKREESPSFIYNDNRHY